MKKNFPSIDAIDALLPQTQCQLCEYEGCRPYAEALAEGDALIDRCLPGGVDTLLALGALLDIDPAPYKTEMQEKTKVASLAVIREEECIGCTKCIQACPVDAIIGAGKLMHTVIQDACTGCELCLPPCPVDCIDFITLSTPNNHEKEENASRWRLRYHTRNQRLSQEKEDKHKKHQAAKLGTQTNNTITARQAAIAAAVARVKAKKKAEVTST